jgi:hypothetical protein
VPRSFNLVQKDLLDAFPAKKTKEKFYLLHVSVGEHSFHNRPIGELFLVGHPPPKIWSGFYKLFIDIFVHRVSLNDHGPPTEDRRLTTADRRRPKG